MKILIVGVVLLTFLLPGMQGQIFTQPEQVHISYGSKRSYPMNYQHDHIFHKLVAS